MLLASLEGSGLRLELTVKLFQRLLLTSGSLAIEGHLLGHDLTVFAASSVSSCRQAFEDLAFD